MITSFRIASCIALLFLAFSLQAAQQEPILSHGGNGQETEARIPHSPEAVYNEVGDHAAAKHSQTEKTSRPASKTSKCANTQCKCNPCQCENCQCDDTPTPKTSQACCGKTQTTETCQSNPCKCKDCQCDKPKSQG